MTSTEKGTFGNRNSSRVLRPPGGGSSNIFGFAEEPQKPAAVVEKSSQNGEISKPATEPQSTEPEVKNPTDEESEKQDEAKTESTDADSVQSSTEIKPTEPPASKEAIARKGRVGGSGYNPITGEAYSNNDTQVNVKASDSPKTQQRVRQPPGGASTKLW